MNAFDLAKHITNTIGLIRLLKEDDSPEGASRVDNVEELLNAIMEFSDRQVDETTGETAQVDLATFMEEVALVTDADTKKDPDADTVTLMTIHSAKGLEFPYVYVVGMEENLFPGIQSLGSRAELEEERRLFYVAVTRAMTKLILSYAERRYRNGNLTMSESSRFLEEIDASLLERPHKASFHGTSSFGTSNSLGGYRGEPRSMGFRPTGNGYGSNRPQFVKRESPKSAAAHSTPVNTSDFVPSNPELLEEGMRVLHQKFGLGTVVSVNGAGANKKATVKFDTEGVKNLMLMYAKLKIVE